MRQHFKNRKRRWPTANLCIATVLLFAALIAPLYATGTDEASGSVAIDPPDAGEESSGSSPEVIHLAIDTIIHPVAAEFLVEGIAEAEKVGAEALVIELSTPGGLLTSTRAMSTAMLSSPVPIVVYVSPRGAQAASAGFFLLMAGDIAAMAPGTNTGAAHPVAGSGGDIEGDMGDKVEQDAAATIRSLAARSGRDEQLAESAVLESRSFTANEALELGLIDLVSPSLTDLLAAIDGREVAVEGKPEKALATRSATVRTVEMSPIQKILSLIAHPNIAYILLSLGGLGLYVELTNPGAIFPGVVGAIFLVLAFYSLSVLPVNYAGMALLGLAMLFFIAEIKVTSFGLLTVAGLVCLVLGSLMLFRTIDPALKVSLDLVIATAVLATVVVGSLMWMVLRVHRGGVRTGAEGLLSEIGVVRREIAPVGKVFVHGELWTGRSDEIIGVGEEVQVTAVDGMTLDVRRRS